MLRQPRSIARARSTSSHSSSMQIAIFCHKFWPAVGGLCTYTGRLAEYLVERGHHVRVFTMKSPPDTPSYEALSPNLIDQALQHGPRQPPALPLHAGLVENDGLAQRAQRRHHPHGGLLLFRDGVRTLGCESLRAAARLHTRLHAQSDELAEKVVRLGDGSPHRAVGRPM